MPEIKKMKLSDCLRAAGLSTNASSYDGRSICLGDITAEKLFTLYKHCIANLGNGEQKAEVIRKMIMDLPTLEPTLFIEFIQRLPINAKEGEIWWWDKESWLSHYSNYHHKDLLTMPSCPQSEQIKKEFASMLS